MSKKKIHPSSTIKIFRIIFIICAVYFFIMGAALVFIPHLMIQVSSNAETNPIIIGMLRGAGGATIPYSLIYLFILKDPQKRLWAMGVILFANVVAIVLDLGSVILGEYKMSYAMWDIPVELLSIVGITIIWIKIRSTGIGGK